MSLGYPNTGIAGSTLDAWMCAHVFLWCGALCRQRVCGGPISRPRGSNKVSKTWQKILEKKAMLIAGYVAYFVTLLGTFLTRIIVAYSLNVGRIKKKCYNNKTLVSCLGICFKST
jgi:hypothetical protein